MRVRASLVAVLLAGVLAAACGGAAAPETRSGAGSPVPVPGVVVYTVGRDLFVRVDGEDRLVVDGEGMRTLLAPALSPDRRRAAVVSFNEAFGPGAELSSDIHLVDLADGSEEPLLVHEAGGEFYWAPRWTADGTALLYAHQINEPDENGRVFRIAIERLELATGEVTVVRDRATEPHPSPDGTRIVFVDDPALTQRMSVLDLTTGQETVLADLSIGLSSFSVPQWSPDGEWIAAAITGTGPQVSARPEVTLRTFGARAASNGIQDIWLIRPDGSGLLRITTILEDNPDFAWSDDGRHILVRGLFGVYLVDAFARSTQTLGAGEFHGGHDWSGALPPDAEEE